MVIFKVMVIIYVSYVLDFFLILCLIFNGNFIMYISVIL